MTKNELDMARSLSKLIAAAAEEQLIDFLEMKRPNTRIDQLEITFHSEEDGRVSPQVKLTEAWV